MTAPLGVILAGGKSSRMGGGDKCLLPLGEATLLTRVMERIAPQVSDLALNANGDAARFASYDLPVVTDSIAGHLGPLAGVLAGLDWAAEQGGQAIVTVAADTPFFPRDLVSRLQEAGQGMAQPLVLASTPDPERRINRHPTFGLWPVALRDDLRDALNDGLRKVVLWTDKHEGRLAEFPVGAIDPFFNVNTPDDLAQAERML